jgi:hypothetical protein
VKDCAQTHVPEGALLEDIHQSVDWQFVMGKLREKYKVAVQDDVAYVKGDIVEHQKEIAYQLDIDVKVRLSVICDKLGNCLKISTARHETKGLTDSPGREAGLQNETNNSRRQEMARMATGLADMIADINQSTV